MEGLTNDRIVCSLPDEEPQSVVGDPEGILRVEVGMTFISPPNIYMSNTGLVPGSTGGYTARWCQRAV